ncbi:MAG: N-acetylmuramoyl-L-alanine amidase [Bacillota bacterium]
MFRAGQWKRYIIVGALLIVLFNLALTAAAQPLVVEVDRLNVRSGPGTGNQILSVVTRGTVLKTTQEKDDWAQVVLPAGNSGWIAVQYTAPFLPERYATVNISSLNVRSGPGTSHAVIDKVTLDIAVPILQEQNDWFKVLLPNGKHGWIAGWHSGTAKFQGIVSVKEGLLNLRGGPGTTHAILAKLPAGEVLAVLGKSGSWLKVARDNGATGWVAESYTTSGSGSQPGQPNSPAAGKTIVLDPGHGGSDPGAVGVTGYYEKTVNLAVARELAALLEKAGARVVMTRIGDTNPTLAQRVNLANSSAADVFVSIHSNAHPQAWVSGTETYYYAWNASNSRSSTLANHLQQQLVGALGLRNIGIKSADFYVVRNTYMPAALVEIAFLSNYGDEALLRKPQTHSLSAEALFRGLEAFFR